MNPPAITDADVACAIAGDFVGPEDAAAFLGEPPSHLAEWRKSRSETGPAFVRYGPHLIRYPMAGLIEWRARGVR